jgi:glutamine cyclotransferase
MAKSISEQPSQLKSKQQQQQHATTPTTNTTNKKSKNPHKLYSKKDLSRDSLVHEFKTSPAFYLTLAILFFVLTYILSSYILFPIVFPHRYQARNEIHLYDDDSYINDKQQQQTTGDKKFFRTSSPALPPIIPLSSLDQNSVDLPPELQRTHKFKPLSNENDGGIQIATKQTPQGWYLEKQSTSNPTIQVTDAPVTRPITPITNEPAVTIDLSPTVIASYPHDATCFTQGYAFHNGRLYESCGLYQKSRIQTVNPQTGATIARGPDIPALHFAEGLAIGLGGMNESNPQSVIYLLTWKENVIHRFNADTFEAIPELTLQTHGWGIAIDPLNQQLVISDGSSTLFWYDQYTMTLLRTLTIQEYSTTTKRMVSVSKINELEWVGSEIWANVWYSTDIICINPANGQVARRLQSARVYPDKKYPEDVFNGIAFGQDGNGQTKLLVTGKWWSKTFELDWTQLVKVDDDGEIDPIPAPTPTPDDGS